MTRLVCLIFWHEWRPAGYHYRVCLRCSDIEAVVRDE